MFVVDKSCAVLIAMSSLGNSFLFTVLILLFQDSKNKKNLPKHLPKIIGKFFCFAICTGVVRTAP